MTDPERKKRDDSGTGTATSGVADELVRMILGLSPGSSLPSEAALAIHHGVSRVTVREAVKMVAGRGLLELARGRRAVVREPDASALGQFITSIVQNEPDGVLHLVEARMSLEVQCAGLAAQRATPVDIAAITDGLSRMRQSAPRMDSTDVEAEAVFHAADVDFHEAIANASKNLILIGLFGAMATALQELFFLTRKGRDIRGQTSEYTLHAHQRILDCVVAKDQQGAEAAMRVLLSDASLDLRAVRNRPR